MMLTLKRIQPNDHDVIHGGRIYRMIGREERVHPTLPETPPSSGRG
jgi:hypothetical protein